METPDSACSPICKTCGERPARRNGFRQRGEPCFRKTCAPCERVAREQKLVAEVEQGLSDLMASHEAELSGAIASAAEDRQEVLQLKQALRDKGEKVAEVETIRRGLEADLAIAMASLDASRAQREELRLASAALEKELGELKSERDTLLWEVAQSKDLTEQLKGRVQDKEAEVRAQALDIDRLLASLRHRDLELTQLQDRMSSKISDLSAEVASLTLELEAKDLVYDEVRALRHRLASSEEERRASTFEARRLSNTVSSLKAEIGAARAREIEAESSNKNLRRALALSLALTIFTAIALLL